MNLFAAFRRFFTLLSIYQTSLLSIFPLLFILFFDLLACLTIFFTKSFLLIFCHTLSGLKPKEDRLGSDSQAVFGL